MYYTGGGVQRERVLDARVTSRQPEVQGMERFVIMRGARQRACALVTVAAQTSDGFRATEAV